MDNQKEADMYSIEKMMTVSESRIKDVEFYLSSVVEKRSNDAEVYAAAYVLLQFKKNKMVTMDELKDYIQNDMTDTRGLFVSSVLRNGYSFVEENINRFSEIELAAFVQESFSKRKMPDHSAVLKMRKLCYDVRDQQKGGSLWLIRYWY